MQISDNIYQILGGMYANIANVYAVRTSDGVIIIDTAESQHDYQIMQENLMRWGLDSLPVSCILLTHKHFGHIGNIWRLRGDDTKVVAGERDSDAIETGDIHQILDYSPFPEHERYVPCHVDYRVTDGDELSFGSLKLKCVGAPGHTNGSMVYAMRVDGKDVLFTGDIINISRDCKFVSTGWEGGVDFDTSAYWWTLDKLSNQQCDWILPGHGQLCLKQGGQIFQRAKMTALLKFRQPCIDFE